MNKVSSRPRIGVAAIVWRGDKILLGQRITGQGICWQFPGGHLETGETVCECAVREVLEETGLQTEHARHVGFTDAQFQVGDHYYTTLYVSMHSPAGEAMVLEPDRCAGWSWFDYNDLPAPLFEPIALFLAQHADLKSACSDPGIPSGEQK